ncbi:HNH endonuclease [Devosia sp. 2618]|uniref:HNH endonuclease n=1 Tax=Devosia sp. 2618 TaxID=3156454 RepID=UPI00339B6640
MPTSPKRFRSSSQPTRQQQTRIYDNRRGSAASRGYGRPWAKAAKGHMRNSPLCVGCLAAGDIVPAELVDHVEPHKGDTVKFWNTTLWQSSCRWHHDVVKQRLELMWARGAITIADLWIDSPFALKLAAKLRSEADG